MTPKEKAEELVNKMMQNERYMPYEFVKQCALIAVDEILSNNVLKHRICGYELITSSHVEFWQQVKNEIELL